MFKSKLNSYCKKVLHSDVNKAHWGKRRYSFPLPFFSQINSSIFLKPISRQIIKRSNACWSSMLVRLRRAQKCFGRLKQSRVCCYQRSLMMSNCFGIHSPTLRKTYVICWNSHSFPNLSMVLQYDLHFLKLHPLKKITTDAWSLEYSCMLEYVLWEMSQNSNIILHINQCIVQKSKGKEALKFLLAFI